MKALLHLVPAIALVLSLPACYGPSPTTADVVGEWSDEGGDRLRLGQDGSVEFHGDMAIWAISSDDNPGSGVMTGRWVLSQEGGKPWRPWNVPWWDIDLHFETGMYRHTYIHYIRERETPVLFLWEGEEGGARIAFHRREASGPLPAAPDG